MDKNENQEWQTSNAQSNMQTTSVNAILNRKSKKPIISIIFSVMAFLGLCVSSKVALFFGIIAIILVVISPKDDTSKKKTAALVMAIVSLSFGFVLMLCEQIAPYAEKAHEENQKMLEEENGEQVPDDTKENSKKANTKNKKDKKVTENNKKEWEKAYEDSDIQFVDLKYLSKNAKYYKGQIILSVWEVDNAGDEDLQFDTDDSNFFLEVTCNFDSENEISDINEEDKVCFIGKVSSIDTYFGNDTVTLENCYIVSKGENVSKYQKKIKNNSDKQKKYVSDAKSKAKKAKKKAAEKSKSDYIKKCKEYPYKSIQRHPDKYDGKKIKISGTVIQVMEGWFDTVSLRVEDSSGDIWYIDYSYSDNEAKILEDDKISVYGESSGTETYTTILGNSQTIPSIDAKYIK